MFDPEHLLGEQVDLGITCALIPRDTAGIEIGRRHLPLNIPFQNGPLRGHDVFVPLDCIIGGLKMAGLGWRMLVEQPAARWLQRSRLAPMRASGASSTRPWDASRASSR